MGKDFDFFFKSLKMKLFKSHKRKIVSLYPPTSIAMTALRRVNNKQINK